MEFQDRLRGCLVCGAIGDAIVGKYEGTASNEIITQLIQVGGDTDTTCSMAGQIIGALRGTDIVPASWMVKYNELGISDLINRLVKKWSVRF